MTGEEEGKQNRWKLWGEVEFRDSWTLQVWHPAKYDWMDADLKEAV